MACIKGYNTITGKPCVDKLAPESKYVGAFDKGPHQFYQNVKGIGPNGKRDSVTIEEAVRTGGNTRSFINNFDDTYRDIPMRKKGGSVMKSKMLRNAKGSRRSL